MPNRLIFPKMPEMTILRYGVESSVQVQLADGHAPEVPDVPRGPALDDVSAAVADALDHPLDYPPLARCVTPADRVVLALDRNVSRAAEITAATVDALIRAGVAADGIAVLRPPADHDAGPAENPCRLIAAPLRRRIELLTHDPTDRRQLAYLAANESGGAILVNRALHEADVIVSIGCMLAEGSGGYFGIHGAIYPTFSDAETIERFCDPTEDASSHCSDPTHCHAHAATSRRHNGKGHGGKKASVFHPVAEADHVAWLLGVQFTIQVIPAAGDGVLHVLAGQSDAVRRRGEELYHAAWSWPVAAPVGLVVAAVEGAAGRQTWENFGRALETACLFVEEGGAIAVCCDLDARPGPAMQRLAAATSHVAALRQIGRRRPPDARIAGQLARALDRGKVYLLSGLEASVVEELDMIPIEKPEELARLARHYQSCVLLPNAPFVAAVENG